MIYARSWPLVLTLLLAPAAAQAVPLRTLPNLQSLTFYERTTTLLSRTFAPGETDILTRLADITNGGDLTGASREHYDLFFSDSDGSPNVDGAYLTIEGVFPGNGGFNVADVSLNFAGSLQEFADRVERFVLGSGGVGSTAGRAADGDLSTHTTFGTADNANRMAITLGFASSVPEPGLAALLLSTGLGLALLRRASATGSPGA